MLSRIIWAAIGFAFGWLLVRRGADEERAEEIATTERGVDVASATMPTAEVELISADVAAGLVAEMVNLRETVAALQASVGALDKQWGRVGREQFKANTLTESQQQQAQAALEQLRDLSAKREADLAAAREQLRDEQTVQRLKVIERILPALDGMDEAITAGMRLLARAPQSFDKLRMYPERNATPPETFAPTTLPALTLRQRLDIALGRADVAQWIQPPPPRIVTQGMDEWRASVAAWLQGVGFVRERLLQVLAAEDVLPINAEGEPFNPHWHIAIETVTSAEVEPGTVVAEYRRGYLQGERVWRPSQVAVARAEETGVGGQATGDEGRGTEDEGQETGDEGQGTSET